MDKYYCTNCGATLNDQSGFDPGKGTWTCAECGQHLMDNDIYEGDKFKGVAWYCDNCGVLLNRQSGFSDSLGTWTCTECYHVNGTTKDDILGDDEIIKCPNCKGALNKQSGFNEYNYKWECTYCGTKLHRKYTWDDFEEIDENLICPNCDAYLPSQSGFSKYDDDWTCDECGAELHRDYSIDHYEVVDQSSDYDMDDDDEDEQVNDDIDDNDDNYNDSLKSNRKSTETRKKQTYYHQSTQIRPESELKRVRFKAFIFNRKKIQIGFDYTDLLRKNISEVKIKFFNQAFKNIKAIPIYDIYVDSEYTEGEVEQIVISGSSFFEASDYIPYDAEIIITYHAKKIILIPFSRHSLLRKNYVYVGDMFQELGFTEIYERPIKDLITGWITKDGSVENIYIANSDSFKKNSSYEYDVKIVIEYHTFKRNRT